MSEPFLLVLTGPPGAGKSTMSRYVAAHFERSAVIEGDFFWASLVNGGIAPWEPAAAMQNEVLVRAALHSAALLANAGFSTVLEGIIGPWFMDVIKEEFANVELPIVYMVLRPTLATCLDRTHARLADPRHANALSDEGPVRHMHDQFSRLGLFERHVLDTSEHTEMETGAEILRRYREEDFALSRV
jgi:predicted kinase